MPLSKQRNRDRMRVARATQVQPKPVQPVQPVIDAISPSVRREGYGKASSTVQPIVRPFRPAPKPT